MLHCKCLFIFLFQTSSPIEEQPYSLQASSMYSPPVKQKQQQGTSFPSSTSSPTVQFQPVQVCIVCMFMLACPCSTTPDYVTPCISGTSSHGVPSTDGNDGPCLVLSTDDALPDVSTKLHCQASVCRSSTIHASRRHVS